MGNKIPCGAPYDWVPGALDRMEAALRGAQNRSENVRGILWEGLNWVELEAAKGRYPLRPRAVLTVNKKQAFVAAYSLTGEYVEIPDRLERVAKMLTAHERERYAEECREIVKVAKQTAGQQVLRWSPDGKHPGVVITFTVDRADKSLPKIARTGLYEPEWTVTSLARELLARRLDKYAPKGWDDYERVARGNLFFRTWQ